MAMLPVRRGGQSLTVINPSREFEDIYNRMGQLMNMALGDFTNLETADMPWTPLADFRESNDAYIVNVELPGIRRDQLDTQVQDRELVITGEMKDEGGGNDGRRHRSSRRMGRFEYRTYLPSDIKADKVSAKLHDGLLTVTVPKSETAKPRQIVITEG
jgi:HSP20 family protein